MGTRLVTAALLTCAAMASWGQGGLPLPEGCAWVQKPAAGCPVGDAAAYAKWVEQHGPVVVRLEAGGLELVWVPGGTFTMGDPDESSWFMARDILAEPSSEAFMTFWAEAVAARGPAHEVQVSGFWISRTEVTVDQWRRAGGQVPSKDGSERGCNDQGSNHPVVAVGWYDAAQWCEPLGLRLPTEAEWEFAARGPQSRAFPWGNEWNAALCAGGEAPATEQGQPTQQPTVPVGGFPRGASWCGALDMTGNAAEWCWDWYDKEFYASAEASGPDPVCTNDASGQGVLRGSLSAVSTDEAPNCSERVPCDPQARSWDYGFRPVIARGIAAAESTTPAAQEPSRPEVTAPPTAPTQPPPPRPDDSESHLVPATADNVADVYRQLGFEVEVDDSAEKPSLVCTAPGRVGRLVVVQQGEARFIVVGSLVMVYQEPVRDQEVLAAVNEANRRARYARFECYPDEQQVYAAFKLPVFLGAFDPSILATMDQAFEQEIKQAEAGPFKAPTE